MPDKAGVSKNLEKKKLLFHPVRPASSDSLKPAWQAFEREGQARLFIDTLTQVQEEAIFRGDFIGIFQSLDMQRFPERI